MKRSGYRTIFHIYLIFFLSLLVTVLLTGSLFFFTVTISKPDGSIARSDWPKAFTEDFKKQIIFINRMPQIKQEGIVLLQDNEIGIQILDPSGYEVFSYQKPNQAKTVYSSVGLLQLYQTGRLENSKTTAFLNTVSNDEIDYTYILYFPTDIFKVTMYLNGERFIGGKTIILPIMSVLLLAVLISGAVYGFWTTKAIKQLTVSIQNISLRSYSPAENSGMFHELYNSLNTLDKEIKISDQLQKQTEKLREEWIANITHDLKTPLSPVKGYAEILLEDGSKSEEQCKRYAKVMLKNISYMETLIDDLKLTYQLENGMFPINREEKDIVRFLKELAIDILNTPDYEERTIHFESSLESILFSFDQTLFTRAFRNLIINAFIHGKIDTEVILRVSASNQMLQIEVADNGNGMNPEEREHLFDRYYRGMSTEKKPEGTGLGLAITKNIISLHSGIISVSSIPGTGTTFQISFSDFKVN